MEMKKKRKRLGPIGVTFHYYRKIVTKISIPEIILFQGDRRLLEGAEGGTMEEEGLDVWG